MTPDVLAAPAVPSAAVAVRSPVPLAVLLYAAVAAVAIVTILAPLAAMLVQAFTSGDSGLAGELAKLDDAVYWRALGNTLLISGGSAVLATLAGTALAWLLVRTDTAGAAWLEQACQIPIFVPPFVGAVAWTLMAAPRIGLLNRGLAKLGIGWQFDVYTLSGMVWVMGIYLAPYVMMIVAAALRSMDPSLEEAAQISGLSRTQTALRITAPLLAPAIASGAGVSFAVALGLFGTPMVLGWSRQVYLLTSRIWLASQEIPSAYDIMALLSIYLLVLSGAAVVAQKAFLRNRTYFTVTGKGFRPRRLELGGLRWGTSALAVAYVVLTILGPIAILLVAAMSTYTWSGVMRPGLLIERIFYADAMQAIWNSVVLSVYASTLAVAAAVVCAWIIVRTRAPGRGVLEYTVLTPISVPGITFGVGVLLLWLYIPLPVYGTSLVIVLAFVGRFVAYGVRTVTASLGQIHPELEESARVFGYGPLRTFRAVTAPLIMPGVIASWLLIFSFCMTELSMVVLLYTSDNRTLSTLVFELWSVGDFSHLSATSLAQVVIGLMFMALSRLLTARTGLKA